MVGKGYRGIQSPGASDKQFTFGFGIEVDQNVSLEYLLFQTSCSVHSALFGCRNQGLDRSVRDVIGLHYSQNSRHANTVIGTPIFTASGCQIIPISRVTMGYLSGGSDIGECKVIKADETVPFAGGSGAIVSVKPAGFLLDDGKTCRYVHAGDDPLDNLLEKATDFLKGLQNADAD